MNDLICVLHPEHMDEYFSVTESGHIIHCRHGQKEPVRDYGEVPEVLTYYKIKQSYDYQTKKYNVIEDEYSPYKGDYIGEIIWPWFSVFQEYGTNGCVCNLETGEIKRFSRESYYSENTCFSVALFVYQQQVCLLHQTLFNQLDITNLESGVVLTDKEDIYRQPLQKDKNGNSIKERKDGVDYFHGRITFSPDYKYFVDTGWVWQPEGVPYVYRVEDFLKEYENARIGLLVQDQVLFGYDWDQYAVWFDDNTFAFDFAPDEEVFEETRIENLPKNHKSIFVTFSMTDVEGYHLEGRTVERLPFYPFCVRPRYEPTETGEDWQSKDYCPTLYFDRKENLLFSIEKNRVLLCKKEKTTGLHNNFGYTFAYPKPHNNNWFYSKDNHALFETSGGDGSYSCKLLGDVVTEYEEEKLLKRDNATNDNDYDIDMTVTFFGDMRKQPPCLTSGQYRPHLVVLGGSELLGIGFIDGYDPLPFDVETLATAVPIYKTVDYSVLKKDTEFYICEAPYIVGKGKVLGKNDEHKKDPTRRIHVSS